MSRLHLVQIKKASRISLLLAASIFALSSCGGSTTEDDVVFIGLRNLSNSFVHLLGPGESASRANQLAPFDADPSTGDDIRFIQVSLGTPAITIRAVIGGSLVADEACEVPGGDLIDANDLDVVFDGRRLICQLF